MNTMTSSAALRSMRKGIVRAALCYRVRAQFAVDQSLIGGVVARIGSTIYDGSVRGQLTTLGRRLTAE